MQAVIGYHLPSLLKASWQGAVLILLVLAVQWSLGGRLKPKWRCALWFLVMIRLALPYTIPSPMSVFNLVHVSEASTSFDSMRATPGRTTPTPTESTIDEQSEQLDEVSAPSVATTESWLGSRVSWMLGLWSVGALAFAIFLFVTHWRLSKKLRRLRPFINAPVMNLLEDCKQQMGVLVPVTLVETGAVGSPSLFGFVRPRLLLPVGLARSFSLEEMRYVFLHELSHIKRHDILIGWLMTGTQILHWFNPLVWLAAYRMRVDRELACDAMALSYGREEENQRYGQTIIKLLESFGQSGWAPSLAGAVENKSQMKERIRMIAKYKKTNRGLALAVALFAGLGIITLTDAEPASSQLAKDLVGTWILVGRPGAVGAAPAVGGRIKSLTDTSWSVTQADPKTGVTIFHHGGTWKLQGDEYLETVEYANENTKALIGKTSKFTIKLEGDTLTLNGIGNPWKEVWKRVKGAAVEPDKSEASTLDGTWHGEEVGGKTKGTASLVVEGSKLEFHGADSNEWYKATFSVYDTTPKQLVTFITECPFPEYKGQTAYAIFQLQDGTLTLAGNEPGNPTAPTAFDSPGVRKFLFKHN